MPETTLCEGRIVPAGAKTHFQTIADSIRFLCVLWPPNSKIPFEYWFQPICKVRIDRFMITIKKRDGKKDLKPLTSTPLPSPNPTPRPRTNRDQPRPSDLHGRSKALFRVWRCIEAQDLQRLPSNFWLITNPENLGLRWTQDPYPSCLSISEQTPM